MECQRYLFDDVPSFDRAEAQAVDEVARLAPGPEGIRALRTALAKILHELRSEEDSLPQGAGEDGSTPVHHPERITIRDAGLASRDSWTPGAYSVRIIYGLGGEARRAIVEIPLASARSLIGRVVGVAPSRLGASDLLTPVEQGILAFFSERIAGLADSVPFLSPLLPTPVLDIVSESASISWGPEGAKSWYSISGSVLVVGTTVPFRLLLPWAMLRHLRVRYEATSEGQERAHARSARFRHPLSSVPVTLTGRIGRIGLRRAELEEIESNDVVLLDDGTSSPGFQEGRLTGTIRLAFDGAEEGAGSIEVDLEHDEPPQPSERAGTTSAPQARLGDARSVTVRVKRLLPGQTIRGRNGRIRKVNPKEGNEAESTDVPRAKGPNASTPRHPEAAALAEEAPVQVRVELGRIRMTLGELAELAPGAILDLRKDPEQPVALMVEDRMIARGELVRIEGALGVRILSLS